MTYLQRVSKSPHLHLMSGLVLLGTALAEFFDTFADPPIGIHHGVLILGLVHVIQALPHILHGAHDFVEGRESLDGEEG